MEPTYPILEFDPDRGAILNPAATREGTHLPERVVLCFFNEVLGKLYRKRRLVKIGELVSEIGRNPIFQLEKSGKAIAVLHPGVGAPLAAGFLEEMIALGGRRFIACGGCGVLDETIAAGHPIVLDAAVRDEGTSYHYLPPDREVRAANQAVRALECVLRSAGLDYRVGKTWTTDGLYRETAARRANRRAEGCIVVEMEAAALFAVAEFRGALLGQVVYGGDMVLPDGWDGRNWAHMHDVREMLFWLAVDACAAMQPGSSGCIRDET